jgi:H+/gluconate symporter-like permease
VIIVWSIICSHRLIFYEIKGKICGIVNNVAAALYHSLYVIIGGGVLPSTIMIVCACLIRRNLVHRQQRRAQLSLPQHQDNSLDHQVLRILSIQIVCYIIFIIPQLCNLVFNTVSLTIPNPSQNLLAVEAFVSFLAECILYLFPVTSFYLYTLTSRTFRKELIKFFRSMFAPWLGNRIRPMIDNTVPGYHLRTQPSTQM